MATNTIAGLLAEALGSEEEEETVTPQDEVRAKVTQSVQTKTASRRKPEDLVATLRYIGGHGVEKLASGTLQTNVKMDVGVNNPRLVLRNRNSGSESGASAGMPSTNRDMSDVSQMGSDLSRYEHDVPSALNSNEAATNFTNADNTRRISPALSAVLQRSRPWSDPKIKEVLNTTKNDPNVNSGGQMKTASAGLRRQLRRRLGGT